jgi:hypothetical protein
MLRRVQVKDTYRLLVDSSPALRHAAAGLVSGLLEELGARAHDQVTAWPALLEFASPSIPGQGTGCRCELATSHDAF